MAVALSILRAWVLPVVFGSIAVHLLVSAWAYAASKFSLTFWLWKQFQIAPRDLPFDASSLIGAGIGFLFGVALSYVLARIVSRPYFRAWLLFALGFLLPLVVQSLFMFSHDLGMDGLLFILSIPTIWCFAIASVAVFWMRSRVSSRA